MEQKVLNENPRYYSCRYINEFNMIFRGRFDENNPGIRLCCAPVKNTPTSVFGKTGKETVENFIEMRNALITNAKNHSSSSSPPPPPEQFINDCNKCEYYKLNEWKNNNFIKTVHFSVYPSPCQCKCIYCVIPNIYRYENNDKYVVDYYNIMFDAANYLKKTSMISPNTHWHISSGEITIHPHKDEIYNLVKNDPVHFLTNCFIYDEKIGNILKTNPNSKINLSIDAGTSETWHKVKSFNNFDKIIENLNKYHENCTQNNQIFLKYIILPGLNDNYDDFAFIIKLMKTLNINFLHISRELIYKTNYLNSEKLIEAVGCFVAMLSKNDINSNMQYYNPKEREAIIEYAQNLLDNETEVLLLS